MRFLKKILIFIVYEPQTKEAIAAVNLVKSVDVPETYEVEINVLDEDSKAIVQTKEAVVN